MQLMYLNIKNLHGFNIRMKLQCWLFIHLNLIVYWALYIEMRQGSQ